ncbi:LpqB family beta-propeller domain-containing protein [Serinibacter arcticus]|uniref:LpqB family beta-propeller domain-containing protein n=1 Tax=Serinibacter arcticus TaxID=1655435 RepID=UPI001091DD9F|nr:LpqB family beta-propeller domain-containing protein [Serinibacter arcticus]
MRPSPRRRRTPRAGAFAVALALALAGCTSLPTSGPVEVGLTESPTDGTIRYEASGPVLGAGPTEIIEGFLQAGAAGLSGDNDFEVARSFLTEAASSGWTPLAQVVVSANESPQLPVVTLPEGAAPSSDDPAAGTPQEATPSDGPATLGSDELEGLDRVQVRLGIDAVADVDDRGVYTASTSRAESELSYELVRVSGQWRIDSVPSGLLLPEVAFGNVFRPVPVMFLTPDLSALVPDVRFVPTRNAVSHALDRLLAGPADWLESGVSTRVPLGTTLEQLGAGVVVTEDDAQAEVRLTGAAGLSAADRDLLFAQVKATLTSIPGILGVSLWLDGNPYEPSTGAVAPALVARVPDRLVALADGVLVRVDGDDVEAYVGVAPDGDAADPAGPDAPASPEATDAPDPADTGTAPEEPPQAPPPGLADLRRPAPAYDEDAGVAVLQGDGRLLHIAPDGTFTVLTSGRELLPPSQDRFGWILTGERDNAGVLTAVTPEGAVVQVDAEVLTGRVTEVRVSRDGARAVVMSERDGAAQVQIVAVVRDGDGVPLRLVPGPVLVGDLASGLGVVWTGATEVAVLASQEPGSAPSVRTALVTGPVAPVSTTAQAVSIAAGNGLGELYLATAEGRLLLRVSLRWEEIVAGVTDPAFAG